jgi:hypothetical protein
LVEGRRGEVEEMDGARKGKGMEAANLGEGGRLPILEKESQGI